MDHPGISKKKLEHTQAAAMDLALLFYIPVATLVAGFKRTTINTILIQVSYYPCP